MAFGRLGAAFGRLGSGATGDRGPSIQLSSSSIAEDAAVGDLVGLLSVSGGSGTYAFTLTNTAGGKFALDGVDDTRLEVAGALDYETATSHLITVEADNGVDDPISRSFTINVTNVVEADEGPPVFTVAPALTGTETEGETLTATPGTVTGAPTIVRSYQWYQAVLEDPPGDNDVVVDGNGDPLTDDPIVGATAATYDATADDVGERLFFIEAATNGEGSASEFSNVTGVIAAAASSSTTLDPANHGTNGALSGGDLVWTATGATAIARSIANHTTGKYYFEVTATDDDGASYHSGVGIVNASQDLNAVMGADPTGLALFFGDNNVYENNASIGTATTFVQGDVIGVAFDADAKKVWFRINAGNWNNSGAANPATGAGGFTTAITGALYAAVYVNGVGNVLTANFGATAYANAAPSGFGNL